MLRTILMLPLAGTLMLFSSMAFALEIKDNAASANLLTTLENAVWAQDGAASDRIVYVVYSPACGWSRKLFEETRNQTEGVQLRWIPVQARGADYVAELRTEESIAAGFQGKSMQATDRERGQRRIEYNERVMESTIKQLKPFTKSDRFSFPTLIYKTADGVKVQIGRSNEIGELLDGLASTPDKANLVPAGIALSESPVSTTKSRSLKTFRNDGDTPVAYYGAPSELSPLLGELPEGYSIPARGVVTGTPWIEVLPFGKRGPKAYVHEPLMARLALLDFAIKRSSGNFAANRTRKIHSHPDPDAPVMTTLEKGYQLRRTGTVELNGTQWEEVVVYADGTKGYVPK